MLPFGTPCISFQYALSTPESSKGSPKVIFPSCSPALRGKDFWQNVDIYVLRGFYPLQGSGVGMTRTPWGCLFLARRFLFSRQEGTTVG